MYTFQNEYLSKVGKKEETPKAMKTAPKEPSKRFGGIPREIRNLKPLPKISTQSQAPTITPSRNPQIAINEFTKSGEKHPSFRKNFHFEKV